MSEWFSRFHKTEVNLYLQSNLLAWEKIKGLKSLVLQTRLVAHFFILALNPQRIFQANYLFRGLAIDPKLLVICHLPKQWPHTKPFFSLFCSGVKVELSSFYHFSTCFLYMPFSPSWQPPTICVHSHKLDISTETLLSSCSNV